MTMNKHHPGTHPMLLQTWTEARRRHASQEHKHDPLSKATTSLTVVRASLTKAATEAITTEVTKPPETTQTPVQTTSTYSSPAPERSATETERSARGPYSSKAPPSPPPRRHRHRTPKPRPTRTIPLTGEGTTVSKGRQRQGRPPASPALSFSPLSNSSS